jgi:hypothetical protein
MISGIDHIAITGNAKLQGLVTELHLTGNKYNIALVSETLDVFLFVLMNQKR